MCWKGYLWICATLLSASLSWSQGNVQINLSYINPANTEYQMTVQNNNTGWSVDQVHVLYTTAGVLQATSTPPGWANSPDVPWDAIPHNLRFEPSSPANRIAPGQSRTFGFKMTTPTPMEDFYVQFRVVNNSNQTKQYAYRVKIVQTLDVPKDALAATSCRTAGANSGGGLVLYQDFALLIPTTQLLLQTYDTRDAERDRVFYPEIPDPEHLEHFFVGNITRTISAPDARENDTWTIDAEGVQWCGGSMGWNALYWQEGAAAYRRATVQWGFSPSVRLDDGSRRVSLIIRNTTDTPITGQFYMYTLGDVYLKGAALRRWRDRYQPNVSSAINLPANGQTTLRLILPAATPAGRFFYGEFELNGSATTRVYFAHREADAPLLIGYFGAAGANRPTTVSITNPSTSVSITKTLTADANAVWRAYLQSGDDALLNDSGFYSPVWRVRVKPRGALSQTYQEVLLPGGDTLDAYLRMHLILGDVDENDCIDDADLLAVLFSFGATGDAPADLNLDGVVDDADLLLVLFNFGAGC